MKKITRFKNPHRRMQQSQVIDKGLPASGSVFFIVFIANPHTISNGQVGGGDSGAQFGQTLTSLEHVGIAEKQDQFLKPTRAKNTIFANRNNLSLSPQLSLNSKFKKEDLFPTSLAFF